MIAQPIRGVAEAWERSDHAICQFEKLGPRTGGCVGGDQPVVGWGNLPVPRHKRTEQFIFVRLTARANT